MHNWGCWSRAAAKMKAFRLPAASQGRAHEMCNLQQECCLIRWTADSLHTWANMHTTDRCYQQRVRDGVKEGSSVTQAEISEVGVLLLYFHVQINTHRMLVLFFPCRAYLGYTSAFLWLVAKAWPGAIYQNNLLSGGNLLLTDKSLPSVGCNGSHLSFFSEYCPSRPPPRQTQLKDCAPFHCSQSESTTAAGLREPDSAGSFLRGWRTSSQRFCTDQLL